MFSYSEKDMEDWLYAHPESVNVTRWIARQLVLVNGKLDLLGVDADGRLVVVEVKRGPQEVRLYHAVMQAVLYAGDITRLIDLDGMEKREVRSAVVADAYYPLDLKNGCLALGVDLWTMYYDDDGNWEIECSNTRMRHVGDQEIWEHKYNWQYAAKRLRGIL